MHIDAAILWEQGQPLSVEAAELDSPGPGEVRIRHRAIAVNFSDVNLRRGGFYLGAAPAFPLILGNEAVGVLDGGERALPPICLAVLTELGLVGEEQRTALAHRVRPIVTNFRGIETGAIIAMGPLLTAIDNPE